jgi:hypothetical protein
MESFKTGAGVATIVDTVGLVVVTIYFYKRTAELESQVAALKKQIAELQVKNEAAAKETRKQLKQIHSILPALDLPTPVAAAPPQPARAGVPRVADLDALSAGLDPAARRGGGGAARSSVPPPPRRAAPGRAAAAPPRGAARRDSPARSVNLDDLTGGLS